MISAISKGANGTFAPKPKARTKPVVTIAGSTIIMGSRTVLDSADSVPINHIRYTMGKKYIEFIRDEINKITRAQGVSESTAPIPKYHLDMNPAVGGRPNMSSAPTVKAVADHGIR